MAPRQDHLARLSVYFCDPSSPWQRGTNENTNGLLRQYFPKGTDLRVHSAEYLDFVADEMNDRPRKTLGWKTPAEALAEVLDSRRRLSQARDLAVAAGAAAHLPGEGAAQCPGPPLRPQGCCASPAATALRAGLDPGDLCGPWAAGIKGQAQGPAPAAHATPPPSPPRMVNTERVIYRHCCNDPLSPSALDPGFHAVLAGPGGRGRRPERDTGHF